MTNVAPTTDPERSRFSTALNGSRGHPSFRPQRRFTWIVVAVAALVTGTIVVSIASSTSRRSLPGTLPQPIRTDRTRPLSTVALITSLESTLHATPSDPTLLVSLGSAYVRRAFETADPAFYPLADKTLQSAFRLKPGAPEILASEASLALARHQFADALELADRALKVRPGYLPARIARVDALVELGNYDDAAVGVDALIEQHAGVSSYSRLSYIRQLRGDLPGAVLAMRQAVSSAPDGSVDRGVASAYLGDVLLESGRVDAAMRAYEMALAASPGLPNAILGSAHVDAARGHNVDAIQRIEALTARVPLPGALGYLADLARLVHDSRGIVNADQLVDASVALFRANGAVVDAELAVLLADRASTGEPDSGVAVGAAFDAATRAYAERHTMFTEDAMAWSLFRAGRIAEALPYARRAVSTSPGVSSLHWHAARIFAAAGERTLARIQLTAAMRNPWFAPSQKPNMDRLAAELGGSPAVA